jgi:hypothetical protein
MQARREGEAGGKLPQVIFLWGPSHFFGRNISVFRVKSFFSGKVPKIGMEKFGESATKAIKTF